MKVVKAFPNRRGLAPMNEPAEDLQADFTRESLAEDYARALFDYWCEARGAARIAPVSAIDPMRMPRACLPYISVLDVEHEPLRLRSRLSGTALVEQLGMNQTGNYLDEIPGTTAQLGRMEWCVRTQRPYIVEDDITFAPKDFKRYQILVLPFGDPAVGVQRLVGVFCFLNGV